MISLRRTVALTFEKDPAVSGPESLGSGQVDVGVREVSQAADVVGVEVGKDDVLHVTGAKAKPLQLAYGCFVPFEHWSNEVAGGSDPPRWFEDVFETIASVHEH
jgi:hypothetical protein